MSGIECANYWGNSIDSQGRAIREDVKQAAKTIWKVVCKRTRAVLGDDAEAFEILERCVARVSRYLDMRGAALSTQNVNALLFVSFRRELWSVKSRRRIPVDISTCADHLCDSSWSEMVESQLDIQNLIRQLSERSRTVLYLRRAGYSWKEVAALLSATVPEVKSRFWRELVRLKSKAARLRPEERRCSHTITSESETSPSIKFLMNTA